MAHIVAVGLNHKIAPVQVRERLAFTSASLEAALEHFRSGNGGCPYAPNAVILSTCNRMEVYVQAAEVTAGQQGIYRLLEDSHGWSRDEFLPYTCSYADEEAVQHLLTVAAGLDSMILGEGQILAQVAEAMEKAVARGAAGKVLERLFRQAVTAGKRARAETAISRGAVSVSHAAVELARRIFGKLDSCQLLLVGAGEMAELAARALVENGAGRLSILNRTRERAEQLATQLGAQALGWDQMEQALAWADIIITSTGSPHVIIRPESIRQVYPRRRNRPLFLIDIAVPRDIAPEVQQFDNVYLYNIDDLQAVVAADMAERRREAPKVEAIIAEERARFVSWLSSLDAVPTIVALREQAEQVRQAEMERALRQMPGLSDQEQKIVQEMTLRIVNKLLHQPIVHLRESSGSDNEDYARAARSLFGLDEGEGSRGR